MALSMVGPYRILERLGAGANGEVFLAEDPRLQRRVALKTLTGSRGSDAAEQRRQLLREARAAARLNHPHIAAVYDVLESDEGVHIVMEYVRGTTLSAQLRQGPPPPMQALGIALQLADALAHAHALGVVHRDLKPANVALAPDGTAKILDFGLARLSAVDLASTPLPSELSVDARHTVGTPPYIPPEHLSGAPVDERGDIYSLGVTLFETLTGRRPFEPTAGKGLAEAILTAPTPRTRSFCPGCPEGLDAIVFKAMARNPAERYASASEMLAELRRLRTDITDAPTQSKPFAAPRFGGRRKVAKVAAAALAVALAIYGALGAGAGRGGTAGGVPSAKVVAVLPLTGAADAETEALGAGVTESMNSALWKVKGIAVVSRAATLKFADRKAGLDAVAEELGANVLVDGMIGRQGQSAWISVELVERGRKVPLWRGRYDGPPSSLADRQWEIAGAVAEALQLPAPAAADRRPTVSAEAFRLYSEGRHKLDRVDMKSNVDDSLVLFTAAIARDREFALAHAGLGEAAWRKYQETREDRWAREAAAAITEAMRLDPKDASVRLALVTIYRGQGRLEEAAAEIEAMIQQRPHWAEAHRQLGLVRIAAKDSARGLAELSRAVELDPLFWSNHASLGRAYFDLGRYPEAARAFEQVIALRPESNWGYSMLGLTRHAMDETDEARRLYQTAIAKGSAAAYANLGALDYESGRYEAAVKSYTESATRDPHSPLLQLNLADACAQLGRAAEARERYRRALALNQEQLKVNPKDTRALARLATIEAKLGSPADAAAHIAQAVAADGRNADVMYYAAVVHARAGRTADALDALDTAIRNGYSRRRAASDPDLKPLRKHATYAALVIPPGGTRP